MYIRDKMVYGLPRITSFGSLVGRFENIYSLVTASFVKIFGESPHAWSKHRYSRKIIYHSIFLLISLVIQTRHYIFVENSDIYNDALWMDSLPSKHHSN